MNQNVIDRINDLGGKYQETNSNLIIDKLSGISFEKTYLLKEFEDYLENSLYTKLTEGNIKVNEEDIFYPRIEYKVKLFTPFKEDSEDYKEYKGFISKDYVKEITGTDNTEFIFIGETDSFPNFYFVSTSDNNPNNPTVYTTDHETFFNEIEKVGTLEDFFNLFVTNNEFSRMMTSLIKELQKSKT